MRSNQRENSISNDDLIDACKTLAANFGQSIELWQKLNPENVGQMLLMSSIANYEFGVSILENLHSILNKNKGRKQNGMEETTCSVYDPE